MEGQYRGCQSFSRNHHRVGILVLYVHTLNITQLSMSKTRPLTAKLRWCLFPSVSHVSDRLELHNNNWASGSQHPGPSESDVYSDVIQEAQSNDLLHTARLLMCLDTPLHDNNARGTKYAVYYASVVTHTVFENLKNGCTHTVLELKRLSRFPCLFIPCQNTAHQAILQRSNLSNNVHSHHLVGILWHKTDGLVVWSACLPNRWAAVTHALVMACVSIWMQPKRIRHIACDISGAWVCT